ncbi:hypothetical protein EMIHUDRAFT_195289 [Emiliania huxleyi CCMP1516]|uniref:Uncharacterized protein n=2 Tax=Emiliania huxleyi TaxID=2903 RepID=A0A0D3JH88_EMIH1|nr:hypothetical protein EMIHUDRAFT_195289 [Emiliania huxleyi CCMP1516]EOD22873.1 hypothetical protein EMIHUDRAFT_195289 [Emiliania huxleyi CCMP1516]|eukprot:XP_005775302.1 hypothetical protein EMIHUDRAFT_195289 [Emiliania huxleyi CCMP1516]
MAAVWRLPVVFFCENNQAEDIPLLPQSTSPEQHPPAGYGDALPTDRRLLLRRSTDGSG